MKLYDFKIKNPFVFKLNNLKELYLSKCENITFSENSLLNIKKIELVKCLIYKSGILINIPMVEELKLVENKELHYLIFNFSDLKFLKIFSSNIFDFLKLDNISSLEEVSIYQSDLNNITIDCERRMLEKILTLKALKTIKLFLHYINEKEISEIKGKNNSLTKLDITLKKDFILDGLLNKFPNLSELYISSVAVYFFMDRNSKLEIIENPNSKINKFSLLINKQNIRFNCASYKDLVNISFQLCCKINNIKECFPLFNEKCNAIFSSLTSLNIDTGTMNYILNIEILNNIYYNLDNIPNLKDLTLKCNITEDISEDFYNKFIIKILKMKLNKIDFSIEKKNHSSVRKLAFRLKNNITNLYYSEKELMEICPGIKFNDFSNIKIKKLL